MKAVFGLVMLMMCTGAHAQTAAARSPWVSASGGAIPEGAVAHGQEADGREQFVCRGAYEGGTHIGKITRGFSGCNIGYGGSEITLPDYEVFMPQRRTREAAAMTLDPTLERGFDENGEPYVEVRLPDGTITRTTEHRVTTIKPDGTSQSVPRRKKRSNAPPPTPPELPEDPKAGLAWMEDHNEKLLGVISLLVNRDAAEMQKFAVYEKNAKAESVFDQITVRTKVASLLAQGK